MGEEEDVVDASTEVEDVVDGITNETGKMEEIRREWSVSVVTKQVTMLTIVLIDFLSCKKFMRMIMRVRVKQRS